MSGVIHRAAERRFAPWKNGGGQTAEILCSPPGAGFDSFDWRISTARVDASGPFSAFAGVTRILTVVEGGAMVLRFANGREERLAPGSAPLRFDGGLACEAELEGAGLLDLNLMVRHPLTCETRVAGAADNARPGERARVLFALEPLPGLGLARHDLLEMTPGAALPGGRVPQNGLLLLVAGPPA